MGEFPTPANYAKKRLTIYGNWSAYDELSDGVALTEELAMAQFDHLLRLRNAGVRFDAYLMDAFWFDPDGAYRTWRRPNWPNGPKAWLDRCHAHDLIPGLWFTANTLCHLNLPDAWQASADPSGWGICLFEGPFLNDYLEVLDFWYAEGVRIFKIDFADFTAAPADLHQSLPIEEIKRRNASALQEGLMSFRAQHPDAIFMGFNGFESSEFMDRTDRPIVDVIDGRWFEVFDSLYAGDPRPADVPCESFWRSVDIYADHMTRFLGASGIPLSRIDNCGFMAGPTGTCYWRGKAGWQAMFALTLARGGDLTVLYGDLSQFDANDAAWMARTQRAFEQAFIGQSSRALGGIPGEGEAYGWAVGNHLIVAANPSPMRQTLRIPPVETRHGVPQTSNVRHSVEAVKSSDKWNLVWHDPGALPYVLENEIELAPFQVVVLSGSSILGFEREHPGSLIKASSAAGTGSAQTALASGAVSPAGADSFAKAGSMYEADSSAGAGSGSWTGSGAETGSEAGADSLAEAGSKDEADTRAEANPLVGAGSVAGTGAGAGPELGPNTPALSETTHGDSHDPVSDLEPVKVDSNPVSERTQTFTAAGIAGGRYVVFARQRDADGALVRTFPTLSAARSLRISIRQAENALPIQLIHDRIVWSGMSWGGARFDALAGDLAIEISWDDPRIQSIDAELWLHI